MIARRVWILAATFSLCALLGDDAVMVDGGIAQAYSAASPASSAILFYQRYVSDLHYGHCRFTPSCSEYARQSIEAYGVLKGSALAADRLVRCNSAAWRSYAKDANGRLVDPVGGETTPAAWRRPRVPRAFLPFLDELYDLPFPGPGGEPVGAAPAWSRASECSDFGDFLAARGDCERAGTEYLRAVYVALSDSAELGNSLDTGRLPGWAGRDVREAELIGWSRLKTAACYFRHEQWADAAEQCQGLLREEQDAEDSEHLAAVMAAASLFNAGEYKKCRRCLEKWQVARSDTVADSEAIAVQSVGVDGREVDYAARAVSVLCDMGCGRWDDASRAIEAIGPAGRPPGYGLPYGIETLSSIAEHGRTLQTKNTTLAPVLSALVPGSGQVYAGRAWDGLRHFILDGLLIYGVVHLAREEEYWAAYLVGGIALPFYAGNIMGAQAAAEDFNRREVETFLSSRLRKLDTP